MKKTLLILRGLVISSLCAQNNIAWLKTVSANCYFSNEITEFDVDSSENIMLSGKATTIHSSTIYSNFYKINKNAGVISTFSLVNENINTFSVSNDFIYTAGSNLTKRDLTGNILSQNNMLWGNNKLVPNTCKIFNGQIYAAYYTSYLFKYDLNGNKIWELFMGNSIVNEKLIVHNGFIYLYSVFYNPSSSRILKYDTLGNMIWSVNPGIYITNFTLDKNDNCYVIGQTLSSSAIVKLNPDGQKLWSIAKDSMFFKNAMVHNDSLYVCGGAIPANIQNATQDDRKGGYAIFSTETGELHSSQFFNLFTGICSDEQFTHIWSNGKTTYIGGRYCSQGYTTFLLKLGTPPVADIKENEKNNGSLSIYPNPGGGLFHIVYTSTEKTSFQINIIDITGKNIYHSSQQVQGNFKKDIDLSKYSKGIYLIEVLDNNKRSTQKIVID